MRHTRGSAEEREDPGSGGEGVGSGGEGSVTSATSAERSNRPSRERKPVAPWVPYKGKGRNTDEGREEEEEEEEEEKEEKEEEEKEKDQEPPKKRRGRPPKNLSALQSPSSADGQGSATKRRKASIDSGAEASSAGNRSTARRSKMLLPADRKALFALVSVFVDPAIASTAAGRIVRSSVSGVPLSSAGAVDWIELVPTDGGRRDFVETLRAILLYDA